MSHAHPPVLMLPDRFAEYEWEVEAKGVLHDVEVHTADRVVKVTFYDVHRLQQDIESDLRDGPHFALKRIVVVPRVSALEMQAAVASLDQEFLS